MQQSATENQNTAESDGQPLWVVVAADLACGSAVCTRLQATLPQVAFAGLTHAGVALAAAAMPCSDANLLMQAGVAHGQPRPNLLLTHPEACQAVAAALAAGIPPAPALAAWLIGAEDILRMSKRYRGQTVLLETGAALTEPEQALAALGAFGEMSGPSVGSDSVVKRPAGPGVALIRGAPLPLPIEFRLLAALTVSQSGPALAAQAALEALALPLGPALSGLAVGAADLGGMFESLQHRHSAAAAEVQRQAQQAKDLNKTLVGLTAERDRYFAELAQLGVSVQTEGDAATLQAETRLADWAKERALLTEQLLEGEQRAEGYFTALRDAENRIDALAGQMSAQITGLQRDRESDHQAAVKAEEAAAQAQTRALAQIAWLEQAAQTDQQQILGGLRQWAAFVTAWAGAQRQIEQAQADLEQAGTNLAREQAGRVAEVAILHGELERHLKSHSWKVTAPLRGIRRSLGGGR